MLILIEHKATTSMFTIQLYPKTLILIEHKTAKSMLTKQLYPIMPILIERKTKTAKALYHKTAMSDVFFL